RQIACTTIEQLPRTPLVACGLNLRYRADVLPEQLSGRFSQELDRRFSDQDFRILGRQFHRLLAFRDGRLLVRATSDPDEKAEILLNFELKSKDGEALRRWLSEPPIAEIRALADRVLKGPLSLREEDY